MSNSVIAAVLMQVAPGAQWTLNGDTLDGLIWLDKSIARPDSTTILNAVKTYTPPLTLEQRLAKIEAPAAAATNKGA